MVSYIDLFKDSDYDYPVISIKRINRETDEILEDNLRRPFILNRFQFCKNKIGEDYAKIVISFTDGKNTKVFYKTEDVDADGNPIYKSKIVKASEQDTFMIFSRSKTIIKQLYNIEAYADKNKIDMDNMGIQFDNGFIERKANTGRIGILIG